jgi:hypothetical protein
MENGIMPLSYKSLSSTSSTASSITCTSANTMYEAGIDLQPAIYTITCVSSTIATAEIYSGPGTLITTATTLSGTVTINLASSADRVRVFTDTGSNVVVTFNKIAAALTDRFSGTLDTITSSGTYTGTSSSGYGYVVLVGGGGGGASNGGGTAGYTGGSGGASGSASKLIQLTGSMPVTIGGGGSGTISNGSAGTLSSFSGMVANGGSGGSVGGGSGGAGGSGGTATGGTYNATGGSGQNGAYFSRATGGSPSTVYKFVKNPIGEGGGGAFESPGGNASGNGAGGGNSGYGSLPGNGSGGALLVLRF